MSEVTERCRIYMAEVLRFAKVLNLTAIHDENLFWRSFIEPSLALSKLAPVHGRLLDVGSGMGIPGIPILIALPGLEGVLVERRKKRSEFLRHVIRQLGLNATVYDADINSLPSLQVDLCVARAVAEEKLLLRMCTPHVRDNAVALLPVPKESNPAAISGWSLEGIELIDEAGLQQKVHRYRFREVSRET